MFPSESGDKAFFVDSEDQFTQMFSGSNRFTAKWKSKEFETPSRTGFSCAKVDVRPYHWELARGPAPSKSGATARRCGAVRGP